MKRTILAAWIFSVALAQAADFGNLDFESADTNNLYRFHRDPLTGHTTGYGPADDLAPAWDLYISLQGGTRREDAIFLNGFLNGLFAVNDQFSVEPVPRHGIYSFAAAPGGQGIAGIRKDFITQTGLVPAEALSLRFLAFGDPWDVYLNDVQIPLIGYDTPLAPYQGREILGDISVFAGQEVELKFVTRSVSFGYNGLDSIRFSPEAVPEPGALTLLLAGGALGWAVRRRRRGMRS
jgi:hypothetical protein